jgi:hypothetical protein
MRTNQRFLWITLICILAALSGSKQVLAQSAPGLERIVTISFQQERLDVALTKLAKQAGFTFSYSPTVVETNKIITQQFVNKTVREILDQLFAGTVQYKQKGKYIILTRATISNNKEKQVYSGYIVDEATGERLRDVTVYDPVSLSSTITNSFGYFEIKIDKPPADLKLAINKKNYSDTVVAVPSRNGRLLNIPISVNKEKLRSFADSVGSKMGKLWRRVTAKNKTLQNVDDTLYRTFQMSFVPFVGTNRGLSANVVNDYSLNIVGGLAHGVRKAELAGVFNMDIGDVKGVQVAGVFNAVGGEMKGVQLAGVFNANAHRMNGAQFAGVFNLNLESIDKFAAAGVLNISKAGSNATQVAGVGNITAGAQSKPHLAGVFNVASRDASAQVAGVFNVGGESVKGAQVSGVFNFAGKNVDGVQLSGVFNVAGKEVRGGQVSSVLNIGKKVNGVQVGLINISDSIRGVPIGLLSFSAKGYHSIEVAADEIFYTNLSFRTGVRKFYNILTAGVKPSTLNQDSTSWTSPKLSEKVFLNVDLTSNQVMQGNSIRSLNLINKLYLGVEYKFRKGFAITAGATLNVYTMELGDENPVNLFSDFQPNLLVDRTSGDYNTRMWIGGKIGLRFF